MSFDLGSIFAMGQAATPLASTAAAPSLIDTLGDQGAALGGSGGGLLAKLKGLASQPQGAGGKPGVAQPAAGPPNLGPTHLGDLAAALGTNIQLPQGAKPLDVNVPLWYR